MSNIPDDLKYTKSHEWVRQLQNGQVEIGVTDHAQSALGDLVFVDVPEPVQRRRFASLYRWKGFDNVAMEGLWGARIADEWAAIDAQREHCNVIIPASGP